MPAPLKLAPLLRIVQAITLGTALLAGAGLWLEPASHFKLQYCLIGAFALLFFSIKKYWHWCVLSLILITFNLSFILPWYLPLQSPNQFGEKTLKILLANVNVSNSRYADMVALIRAQQPDIFVLVESNQAWLDALKPLFPYVSQSPNAAGFGIAVYGKQPLKPIDLKPLPPSPISYVEDYHVAVRLTNGSNSPLQLIAIHPPPPKTLALTALRNQELERVSHYVRQHQSTIVVGDLNTTMWSPAYRRFEQTTNLHNTRQGFGILPTWTTKVPPLLIPIDHCLISSLASNFKVIKTATLQDIGSDHLPLWVELRY
jgi:endonuclease/exonuclease/phosphatase (EEP) superfamily protein YafD